MNNYSDHYSPPVLEWVPIRTAGLSAWQVVWLYINYRRKYILKEDLFAYVNGKEYLVPKHFMTDGASIPRPLWGISPPDGLLGQPAILHDYAYQFGYVYVWDFDKNEHVVEYVSRAQADKLFRNFSFSLNGLKLAANIGYYAVRLGGYFIWKRYRQNDLY